MRLIDADVVKKPIYAEADNIEGMGMTFDEMDGYNNGIDEMFRKVENAPTIDAVEVVRCRDCKYGDERFGMGEHRWCRLIKMSTTPNDFCSYGVRREDGEA